MTRPRPDAPDGKREGAFRTISEVSALLDVPQHVLRFWETRFPGVRPLKHTGGRRYYRPDDIRLLARIRDLLHRQGYTIRGAQAVLKQDRDADVPSASPVALAPSGPPSGQAAAGPAMDLAVPRAELQDLRARLGQLRDRVAGSAAPPHPDRETARPAE